MGSVALTTLLFGPDEQVDKAQEIGALAVQHDVTAMVVKADGHLGNTLIYAEETPIFVSMPWRILEYAEKKRARWWRLEVHVPSRQERPGTIQAKQHLVVAYHPYSCGWVQSVPFKTANKKGPAERRDP